MMMMVDDSGGGGVCAKDGGVVVVNGHGGEDCYFLRLAISSFSLPVSQAIPVQ